MRSATESATRQSSETVGGLLERLTSELEKSTETLRGATELATSQSTEVIGGLLARLTKELDKSTSTLGSAADSIADRSSEALGGLVARLTQELEASSGALREAMEKGSESSVSSLASTGDRLRQELSLVLERLSQTGTALDRIVGSASSKLGDIQGDLGDKVQVLQRSLGTIASQVTELDRLSTTTRNDSGAMVERMAAHTAALAEVARELTAKQQTIDLALQHRQTNLENLFASIGSKSRELDELLGNFASSVEESFTKAQARAQDISAALAASTKGTASTVAGQFEMIRENAGRERDRTAQALQSAYDQANAQLAQIMDQAAEKFRQSVAEVKGMANEMQRELDGARHEMRKGVLELPQETQDAANAMRRVVSDQIKALKELAAVVTASGASFDIAEPAPPTAPTLRAESVPSPRAAAPPREDEASRYAPSRPARPPTEPSPSEEAPRALAAPPRPTTPTREDDALRLAPPLAMIDPVRPRAEPAAAPFPIPVSGSTTEQRNQTGWLSNLLAAASRDEPQTPPQRAASGGALEPSLPRLMISGSLESISLDIARLVDTEAASEMWERWRAGDTTAVSRRLYTAAGQQTFDDLRRRYRSETAFRDSVDRYVKEFERLLAKIGQSDRDGSQSRVAMLSDSGKVYVMLAHASGRLG